MSRVLLFSDIHVHPHKKSKDRAVDCLKALQWVFDTARQEKITNIIFGGDLLHDRSKLDIMTYQKLYELLEINLTGELTLFLLCGNHDMYLAEDTSISSVIPFRSLPGVKIISNPQTIEIEGALWDFMPYTHNPIEDLQKFKGDATKKFLIGHIAIDEARLNSKGSIADVEIELDGDMVKISANLFSEYKYAYFGHYHGAQKLTNKSEYIGSPLQLSAGEAGESKHIIIHDNKENTRKYIENTFSPKHIVLNSEVEFDDIKHKVKNNFIIIETKDKKDDKLSDLIVQISTIGEAQTVNVTKKKDKNQEEGIVVEKTLAMQIDSNGAEGDQIEKFVDSVDIGTLDKSKLVKKMRQIIQSALEKM